MEGKILITGAKEQLGTELSKLLPEAIRSFYSVLGESKIKKTL